MKIGLTFSNSSTKWFNASVLNSAFGQSKYYKL